MCPVCVAMGRRWIYSAEGQDDVKLGIRIAQNQSKTGIKTAPKISRKSDENSNGKLRSNRTMKKMSVMSSRNLQNSSLLMHNSLFLIQNSSFYNAKSIIFRTSRSSRGTSQSGSQSGTAWTKQRLRTQAISQRSINRWHVLLLGAEDTSNLSEIYQSLACIAAGSWGHKQSLRMLQESCHDGAYCINANWSFDWN